MNDFDCAELAAPTNDTIGVTHTPAFHFDESGVGLAEFINLECDFNAALTASATVTTETNEKENRMKYACRQGRAHSHTQTQAQHHPTAPVIDSNDKIDPTGIGLREIMYVGCVFGGILCESKFYYHVNDIFDDYFDENVYDNFFPSRGMFFDIFVYLFNHLK